ncbi:unnamed protein product [Discosporangium mesarthrocarpum]
MCVVGEVNVEESRAVGRMKELFPTGTESYGLPLDDPCLTRYLRARRWDVEKAAKMLRTTLDWRQDFGVEKLLGEEISTVVAPENCTGKIYVRGYDTQGRPIMIMRPRCENTMDHTGNIKHLVYQMERVRMILQAAGGEGKMCLIVDYSGFSVRNSPPMKTSMETLRILQNHYPETLGVAFMLTPPFIFRGFWNAIYPFIDPVTKLKFVFVRGDLNLPTAQEVLAKNFNLNMLEESLGGRNKVPFDSSKYLASPMHVEFDEVIDTSISTVDNGA